MVSWQMHDQATMQKICFVQWHEVAVQMLQVVTAALVLLLNCLNNCLFFNHNLA